MALLRPRYFQRPALMVARDLLGKVLVHRAEGGRLAGRIVETEAYVGQEDLACHASKGVTARTEVMFGPAGCAYVYWVYGMHHCFNVVTDRVGVGAAVLVRALEPLEGISPGVRTDGPGRLCRALHIDRRHNRLVLGEVLAIEDAPAVADTQVARGPRIGVDYAGPWARRPFRFWVKESPHVSRPRKTRR